MSEGVAQAPRLSGLRQSPPMRFVRWMGRRWRQSLQLRVVTSAMVVSFVVVALFGVFLLDRIIREQLRTQRTRAEAQYVEVLQHAQRELTGLKERDDAALRETVSVMYSQAPKDVHLVLTPNGGAGRTYFAPRESTARLTDVPETLMSEVGADLTNPRIVRAYSTMRLNGEDVPVLVLGAPVPHSFQLYMLSPLTSEVATAGLVRRTLLIAGTGLALLITLVVFAIARKVVTPLKLAARVAEHFAAGEFADRMHVNGEDEMARLAETFNRMASNLQRNIGELQELSRVQRRFVADVSHELRTPLTTVRMAADVLYTAREDFPPQIGRSAELLQKELDRFEGLLVDLLEISRYDAGAAVLEAELTDMRHAVQLVVDAVMPLAERRGSEVVIQSDGDTRLLVEADPRRLQRILRNLIFNAVEHGEGRPVTVSIGADQDAVAVVVRDQGLGFRSTDVSRVFSRFWRADPSRARQTGGSGLGLSIALEDARLHGGWLHAWSEPGRGAAFRLTLPRRAGGVLHSSPLPLEQPPVMTSA